MSLVRYTNVHGLPGPIVRAITNDPYSAGDCDISTTRLISPARIETLRLRHKDEIVEDVSERIWSLLGQATHVVAERAAGKEDISERRYFAKVDGWTISGAVDLIEGTTLLDYKVTSAWTYVYGSRITEWTAQGNINRWLAYQNGVKTIEKLENILILRDWSRRDAERRGASYPQVQVVTQPLRLWPIEKAEAYVRERVRLHQAARAASDEALPKCTDEERWYNAEKDKYNRCEDYCSVSKFCSQWKAKK